LGEHRSSPNPGGITFRGARVNVGGLQELDLQKGSDGGGWWGLKKDVTKTRRVGFHQTRGKKGEGYSLERGEKESLKTQNGPTIGKVEKMKKVFAPQGGKKTWIDR